MRYFASIDATGAVLGVREHDAAPTDPPLVDPALTLQEITPWSGWPAKPAPGCTLHAVNGALMWQDDRTLSQAQADQLAILATAYTTAIAQPVAYTSQGGVAQTFQADPASIDNVARMQLAFAAAGATPAGFYWVALDNTRVPFSYTDIQGLAAAMGAQGFTAFANLQAKKDAVRAATTIAQVTSITF